MRTLHNLERKTLLSKREQECVYWIGQGKTATEIATILHLTPCTIKYYLKNVRLKVDSKNMAQTIYKVMKLNLLKY